jgi:Spy/CpxP family protein refolding chaperone
MKTAARMVALFAVVAFAAVASAQAPATGGTPHQMPPSQMGQGHGQGQGMGPMHGQGGPMGALAQLNLTDQQKQDIHKLMADAQPQMQADMQEMQKLHQQLKNEVFGANGPTGNENATAQQVSALQAKMIQNHIALADKLSGILTADQRKQMREMPMDDMMGMMGMMMGGPGMGHGGPPKK